MIEGRSHVRTEHTKEVKDDPYPRPVVVALETPDEEDDANHHPQQDAAAMRRGIPYLFSFRISYCHSAAKVSISPIYAK